jgi:quinoprotein glucose dehydrogenase
MRARVAAAAVAVLTLGAVLAVPGTAGAAIGAEVVKNGLDIPVTFTFADDGTIIYGERFTGELRWLDPTDGSESSFVDIGTVGTAQEQGVLGVAVHPDFPTTPWIYVFATRILPKAGGGTKTRNHLLRYTVSGGIGGTPTGKPAILFVSTPGPAHNGGHIWFAPDGKLYALIGNHGIATAAQDTSVPYGKVLRLNDDGTVPSDNPFVAQAGFDERIFAYGFRNGIGLTTDPETGLLWQTEAGPECNDEVNRVLAGRNYGWGENGTCLTPPKPPRNTNQDGPNPVLPAAYFGAPVTPTGIAFCDGCGLGAVDEGAAFVGSFNDRRIRRLVLNDTRRRAVSKERVYTNDGAILCVEAAPDGSIYFSDGSGIHKLVAT